MGERLLRGVDPLNESAPLGIAVGQWGRMRPHHG
jgi:hypothetical protein